MTRKLTIAFGVCTALLFVLAGCVGTREMGIFDPEVPKEMRCPLEIRNLAVISFDDQPVDWERSDITQNKVKIVIPPGQHIFVVKWYESYTWNQTSIVFAETAKLAWEFLPGHSYRIYQQRIWLIFYTIRLNKIKDVTPKNKKA